MAEPVYEQVAEAVRDRFATIVGDGGDTYWYTPSNVVRCQSVLATWLDASIEDAHFVFVTPAGSSEEEETSGSIAGLATFEVWVAKKDTRVNFNPLADDPNGEPPAVTVLARLVGDLRTCLFGNVTLDGLVLNVVNQATVENDDLYLPGWLIATLTFTVSYDYLRTE